ncbi:hypothetical protein [Streptococcus sanguinis]|uniref:Uncharacterized protein n=1 Tax=Streptococcus sanguinis TaxID=1305 RepID=A0A2X3V2S1_STRSA|nr:hypothetical protein [Streptococcus sanguinis]EGJ45108.1 hypothetical protein HMPREF9396_0021 [Streptococcus sanguinis SK1059]EGQ22208.1 hypothetical protein HMPREF8573_0019 [Streptococcus sanguinis ATCC 29667]EGQ24770.1 hypothetical protein HMPREF9387_0597 [Streptococcus sanguinis SK340]MCY7015888.1 hypothetical protein [Streptococcus sanguinis]SQF35560.1 Uncharacterised protein [Streptococcus sanguinis]
MRKTINILWLEDDLQSTAHKNRTKIVGDILKKKGYEANIIPKGTFEEAKEALENTERIDFFISDFNLEQENTGLSYVEEIRNSKGYKQFVILYSNKSNSALKKDVSSYFNLPETSNFVFANFTFFSVGRNRLVQKNFEEAIDVILSRWDELNALRGEYMYENAELEYLLRNKCPDYPEDKPYRELVKNYFIHELKLNNDLKRRDIERYNYLNNIKENWLMLIDRRNALAHVIEDHEPEKGYFIQSNNENCLETFTIYERNLDKERCDLLEVVVMIKEILV